LFGGVGITGSIGETWLGTLKKRLGAGFRQHWQSPPLAPSPGKDRALPHIGRDAVKIGGPDGVAYFRRAGGHSPNAKQGNSR
jgi:hypothetical protein